MIEIAYQMTPTIRYKRKSKKYLKFSSPTQLFIHAVSQNIKIKQKDCC